MPWAPPHLCIRPHCPGLAESGQRHCIEHRKPVYRKQDGKQPTSAERAFRKGWDAFATTYLAEHGTCADCSNPATEVYYSLRARFTAQEAPRIHEEYCTPVCATCREKRELYRR
jgi:hypothetical protein